MKMIFILPSRRSLWQSFGQNELSRQHILRLVFVTNVAKLLLIAIGLPPFVQVHHLYAVCRLMYTLLP